jgi:Golgi nucleoside diphosphatase
VHTHTHTLQARWAVYIDAGSSGTRAHVFQYTAPSWPEYVQLTLPEKVFSVEPGLSTYAGRPALAASSLHTLLDFAYKQVGMPAEFLHKLCQAVIQKHPLSFQNHPLPPVCHAVFVSCPRSRSMPGTEPQCTF